MNKFVKRGLLLVSCLLLVGCAKSESVEVEVTVTPMPEITKELIVTPTPTPKPKPTETAESVQAKVNAVVEQFLRENSEFSDLAKTMGNVDWTKSGIVCFDTNLTANEVEAHSYERYMYNGDLTYKVEKVEVVAEGVKYEDSIKQWVQQEGDGYTFYQERKDDVTKVTLEENPIDISSLILSMNYLQLDEMEAVESETGINIFGVSTVKKFGEAMRIDFKNWLELHTQGVDIDACDDMRVYVYFAIEEGTLQNIFAFVDTSQLCKVDGLQTVSDLSVFITFDGMGQGVSIEIPEHVLKTE